MEGVKLVTRQDLRDEIDHAIIEILQTNYGLATERLWEFLDLIDTAFARLDELEGKEQDYSASYGEWREQYPHLPPTPDTYPNGDV